MDIKSSLKEHKSSIDKYLTDYLEDKKEFYSEYPYDVKKLIKHTTEFTLRGGKRIRPILAYYSYMFFSHEKLEEIKKVSIFLEFIQSFLLIHDDLMDHALMRRGKPTVHKIYEKISKKFNINDNQHFGNTMAILAGDLANQFAYDVVNKSNFEDDKKIKVNELISKEISEVIFGQVMDIMLGYKRKFTEKDINFVHVNKTANYTFRLPLFTGAILGGANKKYLKILENYGIPCGIAFQIRDDILGIYGKDENTGKSSISDLREGKKTLLVSYAYKNGSASQQKILDRYLGKPDLSEKEAEEVRYICKSTGALDYSVQKCEERILEAKNALKPLEKLNSEPYEFLNGVADFMLIRNI